MLTRAEPAHLLAWDHEQTVTTDVLAPGSVTPRATKPSGFRDASLAPTLQIASRQMDAEWTI
jgi:hypothetical protein